MFVLWPLYMPQVSSVIGAEYRMILLVPSSSCGHGGKILKNCVIFRYLILPGCLVNESNGYGEASTIPIIYAQSVREYTHR